MSDKISRALAFVNTHHAGQMRPGGESQVEHVQRVALRATQFVFTGAVDISDAEDLVVSALLHDVLEDTDATDAELIQLFGERVAHVVRAVSHEEEEEPDQDCEDAETDLCAGSRKVQHHSTLIMSWRR